MNLTKAEVARLQGIVARDSVYAVSSRVGIGRDAILRAAAGQRCHGGTLIAIRAFLASLASGE